MSKDKYTIFAIRQWLTCAGIHHFGVEVVLPNVAPGTSFNTFLRYARANNLAEAVKIRRSYSELRINIGANSFSPGFSAKQSILETDFLRRNTELFELLPQGLGIGRCAANNFGLQIEDQGDLPLGHSA